MPRKQFPTSLALANQSLLAQPSYHVIQRCNKRNGSLPQAIRVGSGGSCQPNSLLLADFHVKMYKWPSVTLPDARLDVVNRAVDRVVHQVGEFWD
jgi:hypothetical protein